MYEPAYINTFAAFRNCGDSRHRPTGVGCYSWLSSRDSNFGMNVLQGNDSSQAGNTFRSRVRRRGARPLSLCTRSADSRAAGAPECSSRGHSDDSFSVFYFKERETIRSAASRVQIMLINTNPSSNFCMSTEYSRLMIVGVALKYILSAPNAHYFCIMDAVFLALKSFYITELTCRRGREGTVFLFYRNLMAHFSMRS
jgi:hypothetical protein